MAKANVAWHRRADLWAPVVVVLTGLLFFADFLFSSKNFYFRDILNFHYPLRRLLLDSYARWEFPLWNPYLYLGQPMLANPNYLAFYPTNLFHLVCSFNYAFKLHFVIHPIAAGVGMYFLQRRLGLPPLASFGGSMTYQFSGIVLSFLNLYSILPAIALIPWIGWAFIRALDAPGLARALLLGLLLSFQAFAFEPMMFQCLIALLAGLAILHLLEASDRRRAWRSLLYTSAVGGLFGVALAAIQILPTLELLPRSARGAGFDFQELTTWSVHPIQLLNTVIPNFFGSYYTIGHVLSWGEPYTHGREGYIVSFFAGTGMVVLALLSVLSPRRRLCGVCSVLALGSVACALGRFNPVYSWMLEHVPLLRLGRYPSKYMLLGVAALAVLTSIGLEVLLNLRTERRARRRPITVVGALAIALGIAFMSVWIFWQSHPGDLESLIRARTDPSLAGAKDFPAIIANLLFSIGILPFNSRHGSACGVLRQGGGRRSLDIGCSLRCRINSCQPAAFPSDFRR
jgi:hypothetical protein